jgi:putative ATP-dependent endonuclease of OLD family
MPEFALIAEVEFPIEGIRVIEFAQCGVAPLLKLADDLGIRWVLLADGDPAGERYARDAREHLRRGGGGEVVVLPARDVEHYLFESGYADVVKHASGIGGRRPAGKVIHEAVERVSKPGLALQILAAADERGSDGVPPVIRDLAETAMRLARG